MNLASIFQQCHACKGEIDAGDMAVFAPKAGENLCWHPACFICSHCEELLVDLVYCFKDNSLYCERHYAELVRRCAACDEVRDSLYVLFHCTPGLSWEAILMQNFYCCTTQGLKPPIFYFVVFSEIICTTQGLEPLIFYFVVVETILKF